MKTPKLRLVANQAFPPVPGRPIPERFICNMPVKLSRLYEVVGGAWVMPQPRDAEESVQSLLADGAVGLIQTHKKMRLVNKVSGAVVKI